MKSQSLLLGPDRRARRTAHVYVLFVLLMVTLPEGQLHAQVGNNNPSGVSGIFNGQVGGCGYDPYTGNAVRSITDIAVAGAVGEYPLALVRTANSRNPSATEVFAWAGGWNHNYNWIMEDSPPRSASNLAPTQYTVDFPDGRVETFKSVTWDTGYYRVRVGTDGSAGVRERLAPISPPSNMYAYLLLSDGGKVKFQATQYSSNGQYFYKYTATAIIDPHGLETTLTWENFGNGRKRLQKVTEPAGRYLQFSYTATNSPRISQVQEFIGGVGRRSVQYYYYYTAWLDHVVYYGNATWIARYQYIAANAGNPNTMPPLLRTCDDPMYPGPMKRIAYDYKTGPNADATQAVYGQILRERYWDGVQGHESSGAMVSELTVGEAPNLTTRRKETRGDGAIRGFIYNGAGYITWTSDFATNWASQTYDTYKWINSVTNFRRITTDYVCDPITGNVTQIKFPLTPGDTPGQGNTRPTINYTYTNKYYLHTVQDEGGHSTTITRDGNNRVSRIDYPDGGYETFAYDSAHLYQLSSHRMKTGGTQTFAYDARHRLQYYSDAYHSNPGNPTTRYYYDGLDRVNGVYDALWHPTNWEHNDRGQITVTTLPTDPVDGIRHTITTNYNPDGTASATINELNRVTSYTYDDYRRLKSVTTPLRGFGDNGMYTTYFYYDASGTGDDYRNTDSNVTVVKLPSLTRKVRNQYDDNRRRISITMGYGSNVPATTNYAYDNAGNLTTVTIPSGHWTTTTYDERNRPSSVSDRGRVTSFTYDTSGRKKSITRPNGQVLTYDSFDAMNRVTQQTATQSPNPAAVTKYAYYTPADGTNAPVGLLKTMQDPHLVANNSTYKYTYGYDLMGRKLSLRYPPDATNQQRTEQWSYDNSVGRLQTFTNRNGRPQTFSYDALNRVTGFTWNDGGITPNVTFGYDPASRLISIDNRNGSSPGALITRVYYNDNLLRSETEQISGAPGSKTVTYTYNADGNRASITYPDNGYVFGYDYNARNQLWKVNGYATYTYDENGSIGNLTSRTLDGNNTRTSYTYDAFDRVTWVNHTFNGSSRWFNYGYYDNTDNRKYIRRWNGLNDNGDVFRYDLADQAIGVQLNVASPQNVQSISQSIYYDANGNRTQFWPYGTVETYGINNLNQYTSRTIDRTTSNATYDSTGNLTIGLDAPSSGYQYDAQNRLTQAAKNGVTMNFKYDGLNRQISRSITGQPTTFSVWDGWDLIEDYQATNNGAMTAGYLYGATGLIAGVTNGQFNYYFQDASGSTSHLTDDTGHLLEWYRYDLQGTPFFYSANNTELSTSNYSVRHLLTGQQWYSEVGLCDLRNRFYSPDIGRFLQPDPIGFWGGNNRYRYCRNNPVTSWDPFGLLDFRIDPDGVTYGGEEAFPGGNGFDSNYGYEPNPGGTGQGDAVVVGGGPGGDNYGNSSGGVTGGSPGGLGALSGPSGAGGIGSGDGGGGGDGKTLANSPATIFLGKFLQGFNAQGGWDEMAHALDLFAALEANLLVFGEGAPTAGVARLMLGRAAIQTPYTLEVASTSIEAQAAIAAARNGATLYRAGELGESMAGESPYWALRSPLSPNYATKMGMPGVKVNFIMGGTLNRGASAIANEAATLGANTGGEIQLVTSPNGVTRLWFYMPEM